MAGEALSQGERLMLVENAELGHEGLKNALWTLWSFSGLKEIRPSYDTIARRMNSHRSTAIRRLNELVLLGVVTKQHRCRESGRQTSNVYEIDFGELAYHQITDRDDPTENGAPQGVAGCDPPQ